MEINELREEFKSSSGFLYWTDSEVDKALNRGLKYLDSHVFIEKRNTRLFRKLESGSNRILFPQRAQVIKDVWLMDANERVRLEKVEGLEELRSFDFTSGTPTEYLPILVDVTENTLDLMEVPAKFADFDFTHGEQRGIAFNRVADKEYYVEIIGRFFSIPLSNENPHNWWTIQYHELVLLASLLTLDLQYRNSSGGAELKGQIMEYVKNIQDDEIEEEMEGTKLVMEG